MEALRKGVIIFVHVGRITWFFARAGLLNEQPESEALEPLRTLGGFVISRVEV
jgi:hypothetical protein